MNVPENPWGAQTKSELRLRRIGCTVCVIGIPAVVIFNVIVIILMDKS